MLIRPDRRVLAVSEDMPPAIDATYICVTAAS